jgi:hypothetical protein
MRELFGERFLMGDAFSWHFFKKIVKPGKVAAMQPVYVEPGAFNKYLDTY